MVAAVFPREVIRITGGDAAAYLQGQVSQDIDALAVGASAWTLLLDPSGRLVAWFRLHRLGDQEFLADMEPLTAEAVLARLRRFVLRTDVVFAVVEGWSMLSVRGDATAPPQPADSVMAAVEWPGFSGTDVVGPKIAAEWLDLDPDAFEEARIRAGVPRMGVDLDETTIPAEAGAPVLDAAVSFTKGCYTGQELVARVDSRGGNVPRPVRRVRSEDPLQAGAIVLFDGDEVGTVTSAAGTWGLGRLLRRAEPGSEVDVGGVRATVFAQTD